MYMKFLAIIAPAVLLLPLTVFGAAQEIATGEIGQFVQNVIRFMNGVLVPAVFAIAFLVFLWGMFKTFILGGSDPEKQSEGKSLMVYAIVGFVIMVSLWGIVNLVARGFGLAEPAPSALPDLPIINN